MAKQDRLKKKKRVIKTEDFCTATVFLLSWRLNDLRNVNTPVNAKGGASQKSAVTCVNQASYTHTSWKSETAARGWKEKELFENQENRELLHGMVEPSVPDQGCPDRSKGTGE